MLKSIGESIYSAESSQNHFWLCILYDKNRILQIIVYDHLYNDVDCLAKNIDNIKYSNNTYNYFLTLSGQKSVNIGTYWQEFP